MKVTYFTERYNESLIRAESDLQLKSIMGVYCNSFSHLNFHLPPRMAFYFVLGGNQPGKRSKP